MASIDMFPDEAVKYIMRTEACTECGKNVEVMCFRGTGICSENCRKDRDNDHSPFIAIASK